MHDGLWYFILKDEYILMPTGIEHSNRLSDIVSVVEPSEIPLADVEFCPLSHGDPPQTMTLPPPKRSCAIKAGGW